MKLTFWTPGVLGVRTKNSMHFLSEAGFYCIAQADSLPTARISDMNDHVWLGCLFLFL